MANVVDRLGRTGWIWVLIAVAAVALLVWWVAEAINGESRVETGDQVAEVEQVEPGADGEQAGDNQLSPGQIQGGQMQGEGSRGAPGVVSKSGPSGQNGALPEHLAQYVDWVENQREAPRVDAALVVRGMDLLSAGVEDVVESARQYELDGATGQGEQRGGGPLGGTLDSPEFDRQYQTAQQSIARLEQADDAQRSEAFHRAATDTAALLAEIRQRSGLSGVEPQVARVQQTAQAIRPDQQLDAQSELVQQFFEQSAQAAVQMTRNFAPGTPGGTDPTMQQ